MASSPHTKLIDAAARRHLSPVGCVQQGRSRIWLLDRGWFTTVVEFQPSSYAKGSFLNVGVHFLWTWHNHLSFDLGYRVEEFHEFENEVQFPAAADQLASRAAQEVLIYDSLLTSPGAAAQHLPKSTEGHLWRIRSDIGLHRYRGKFRKSSAID